MEDKREQIWSRFNHDQANLKRDCVDLLSKCYLMLGQKPDTQQVVLMSQLLYNDLVEGYSTYTIDKVSYIFETAIKESEHGGFVNARNWNIWLKQFKLDGQAQQHYKKHLEWHNQNKHKLIGKTINKAKKLGS